MTREDVGLLLIWLGGLLVGVGLGMMVAVNGVCQ